MCGDVCVCVRVCRGVLVNDYLHPLSPPQSLSFPIWIDGVRVRAHGVDPPPGCGELSAFLFPSVRFRPIFHWEGVREREERGRE